MQSDDDDFTEESPQIEFLPNRFNSDFDPQDLSEAGGRLWEAGGRNPCRSCKS